MTDIVIVTELDTEVVEVISEGPMGPMDTSAINAHIVALDPHPQYLTHTEGDAAYDELGSSAAAQAASTPIAHATNTSNPHSVTKAQVGLSNVDNTSDANKPVSTAQQAALDTKANTSSLGTMSAQAATAVNIAGGTIDGTVIGGTTKAAGSFTTLSATGNTTLGDAPTDTVQVNGYIGVGVSPDSTMGVYIAPTALTGTYQTGLSSSPVGTSAAINRISAFSSWPKTQAAAFTTANAAGFWSADASKGAGSTITNLYGVYVSDQTQGVNNYGVYSAVTAGTNKWSIYASGTANNYFAGNVGIGIAVPTQNLDVRGTAVFRTSDATSGNNAGVLITAVASATASSRYATITLDPNGADAGGIDYALLRMYGSGEFEINNQLSTGYTTFKTNAIERMRIDASGNVGIGATPSAWGGNITALDMPGNASLFSGAYLSSNATHLGNNIYNNLGFKYKSSFAAGYYAINSGTHSFHSAPTGTAGAVCAPTQILQVSLGKSLALEGATTATGVGIGFPATQVASSDANTLDDYREASYTATATGMTTAPTGTVSFVRVGNKVTLNIPYITGTSNATGFTLTGGPTTMRPSLARYAVATLQDNSGATFAGGVGINTTGAIEFSKDFSASLVTFTASGTKSCFACSISYII